MYYVTLFTVIKDRLEHAKHTILANIKDNEDCPFVQHLILDYNSSDGLEQWAKQHLVHYVEQNRVTFYRESSAEYFNFPHARNIAARLAEGSIICNVDVDHYTNNGFASQLIRVFDHYREPLIVWTEQTQRRPPSAFGRIALRKKDFLLLCGYDERLCYGWGYEDYNLIDRALRAGFISHQHKPQFIRFYYTHTDQLRTQTIQHLSNYTTRQSCKVHRQIIENDFQVQANRGINWGAAVVTKNFTETIVL